MTIMILETSTTKMDEVKQTNPNKVVLKEPTLDQIFALCELGYEPPELSHIQSEDIEMTRVTQPLKFPSIADVRCALAHMGKEAWHWGKVFNMFTVQSIEFLTRYEFLEEGEEDMYAFHTLVLNMEARQAINLYHDRLADEMENGAMFGAVQ